MSIQEHLNKIRNAVYGREVRESIAKGIETAYDDASEKDNANMEVKIARGTHPNLRSRLDETTAQLQQTEQELSSQLADKAAQANLLVEKARIDTLVATPNVAFYEKTTVGITGALLIVVSGATTGQINLASVTPAATGYTPIAGDYVRLVYGVSNGSTEFIDSRLASNGFTHGTVGNALRFNAADKVKVMEINENIKQKKINLSGGYISAGTGVQRTDIIRGIITPDLLTMNANTQFINLNPTLYETIIFKYNLVDDSFATTVEYLSGNPYSFDYANYKYRIWLRLKSDHGNNNLTLTECEEILKSFYITDGEVLSVYMERTNAMLLKQTFSIANTLNLATSTLNTDRTAYTLSKTDNTKGTALGSSKLGAYNDLTTKSILIKIKNTSSTSLSIKGGLDKVILSSGVDFNPANTTYNLTTLIPTIVSAGETVSAVVDLSKLTQFADKTLYLTVGNTTYGLFAIDVSYYLRDNLKALVQADYLGNFSASDIVNDLADLKSTEQIACWGDSLTVGVPIYAPYDYPSRLAALTGKTVKNYGVGGETLKTIAGRQGGMPMMVNPTITIPADTSTVEITLKSADGGVVTPCLQMDNTNWNINPCSINGITGTLSYTNSKYYFARSVAGVAMVVDRPTPLITNAMVNNRNDIIIIYAGANGGYESDNAKLVYVYKMMVDYLKSTNKKYIFIGLPDGNLSTRTALETLMFNNFGRHYINWREYLVAYGLSDAGLTATQADTDAIAIGQVPPQLLSDTIHGTNAYYDILSKQVYKRGQELGYWI